jgi:DNA-binding beta-propeller fold protein YncE
MKRIPLIGMLASVLVIGGITSAPETRASVHPSSPALKKTCHYVTKKIHGKKKRVKVCKTVKPKPSPTPTPIPVVPPAAHVVTTIPITDPFNLTFAFGSVWVNRGLTGNTDTVTRIDPATNQVTANIHVDDGGGQVITSGFGSIWENDNGYGMISRIDPQTNTIIARISTEATSPIGIAISPHAVWVGNHNEPPVDNGAVVTKIDPTTNAVVDKVPVGGAQGGPAWVQYAFGTVWAYDQIRGTVDRIDPDTDKVVKAIPAAGGCICRMFVNDASHIWYNGPSTTSDGGVQQIDPGTNTITNLIPQNTFDRYGMSMAYWMQYDAGTLWLSGPCGQYACILRVDAAAGTIQSAWTVPVTGKPGDLALTFVYADGSIWLADAHRVLRIDVSS